MVDVFITLAIGIFERNPNAARCLVVNFGRLFEPPDVMNW